MFAFTAESFKMRKSRPSVRKQARNAEAKRAIQQRAKQERKISRAFFQYLEEVTSDDVLNKVADMYKTGNLAGIVNLPTSYIQKFSKIATRVFISVAEEESKWLVDILDIVQVDESVNPIKKVEISASIDITFNPGDPYAASLMKKAELDLIREISKAQRGVIRKAMTDALNRGVGYVEASRMFKQNIGLTAYQQSAVDNFRRLLEQNDSAALTRVLRDRRFDPSISRAIRTNTPIGADKIGLMSDRYRERMVAMRAETIARTEGQRITNMARDTSTRQMLNKAGIQESEVERIWHSTPDLRTRDTHRAMNNQKRDLNDPFRSPSGAKLRFPGDPRAPAAEVINCRCVLETRIKEGASQQQVVPQQRIQPPPQPSGVAVPSSEFTYEQQLFRAAWADTAESLELMLADNVASGVKWFTEAAEKAAFDNLISESRKIVNAIDIGSKEQAVSSLSRALKYSDDLEALRPEAKARLFTQWIRSAAKKHQVTYQPQVFGGPVLETAEAVDIAGSNYIPHPTDPYFIPKVPVTTTLSQRASGLAINEFKTISKNKYGEKMREMFQTSLSRELSREEKIALNNYTGWHYKGINKVIKGLRQGTLVQDMPSVQMMDKAFGVISFPDNVVTYRSFTRNRFNRLARNLKKGQTILLDKGYMSATISKTVAEGFSSMETVSVKILVPKGSSAFPIAPISQFWEELEVLINRGSEFLVRNVTKNSLTLELLPLSRQPVL